jgi:hypothetical protein
MGQWQRRHCSASLILDAMRTIQEVHHLHVIQEGPNSSHATEEAPLCCILSMRSVGL